MRQSYRTTQQRPQKRGLRGTIFARTCRGQFTTPVETVAPAARELLRTNGGTAEGNAATPGGTATAHEATKTYLPRCGRFPCVWLHHPAVVADLPLPYFVGHAAAVEVVRQVGNLHVT